MGPEGKEEGGGGRVPEPRRRPPRGGCYALQRLWVRSQECGSGTTTIAKKWRAPNPTIVPIGMPPSCCMPVVGRDFLPDILARREGSGCNGVTLSGGRNKPRVPSIISALGSLPNSDIISASSPRLRDPGDLGPSAPPAAHGVCVQSTCYHERQCGMNTTK